MSRQEEVIREISDDYSPQKNTARTLNGYARSIRFLAKDIYEKDTHFIFELIQNAEDNEYDNRVKPSLRFVLYRSGILPGYEANPMLLIENNEKGFEEQDVKSICDTGESKKTKQQGFIGEKGIGFKSVFRVTSCPHIFSNGYNFKLPEKDENSNLGYIVPSWIEPPEILDKSKTSILLPLDKPDFGLDKVRAYLKDIAPETIIFLDKLQSIEIDFLDEKISIEKDGSIFPLVMLAKLENSKNGKEEVLEQLFWFGSKEFQKPANINPESRKGIDSRTVSIAIPFGKRISGKVFAYLPVLENTGLPFLVNADFLLSSAREGLKLDENWNKWLRDCIPEVFVETLTECLESEKIDFREKIQAYNSIPRHPNSQFFREPVTEIKKALGKTRCIFTLPNESLSYPSESRILPENKLWDLLEPEDFNFLNDRTFIVHRELKPFYEILRAISVSNFEKIEILKCFDYKTCILSKSNEWLLDFYRFLKGFTSKHSDLASKKLVKIVSGKENRTILACTAEIPIYFPCESGVTEAMEAAPEWLKDKLSIAFVEPTFFELLSNENDWMALEKWMTDCLMVKSFSLENYCCDILDFLNQQSQDLDPAQIADATSFLTEHASNAFNLHELPIVLSNHSKIKLSAIGSRKKIVVPENFDPEKGWQNIWKMTSDQAYFFSLADTYKRRTVEKLLLLSKGKIEKYPGPLRVEEIDENFLTAYEEECLKNPPKTNWAITISDWRSPFALRTNQIGNNNFSASLFSFFQEKDEGIDKYKTLTINYFYRTDKWIYKDSEFFFHLKNHRWLPTQKGLVKPSQAFLPRKEIQEILGDTVPYFTGNGSETEILEELGVKTGLTVEVLMQTLIDVSISSESNSELVSRIYGQFASRTQFSDLSEVAEKFRNNRLIFIPEKDARKKWFKSCDVIWSDDKKILDKDIICLEKYYHNLKEFFVKTIGVKESADPEYFAQRWLGLQKNGLESSSDLRETMDVIYHKLLPVSRYVEKPNWWEKFVKAALIFTQNNNFRECSTVILPDDGMLKRVFANSKVDFAWRPEKDSFNQWASFYESFNVPRISESVTTNLADDIAFQEMDKNRLITECAIIMLSAWLREKDIDSYKRFYKEGIFEELSRLKEAVCNKDIKVLFTLKTTSVPIAVEKDYPVFWDRKKGQIIFNDRTDEPDLKKKLATEIAKGLMNNNAYKDLSNWIELILGANDTRRIRDDGWPAPREILKLFTSRDAAHEGSVSVNVNSEEPAGSQKSPENQEGHKLKQLTRKMPGIPEKRYPTLTDSGKPPNEDSKKPRSANDKGALSGSYYALSVEGFEKAFNKSGQTALLEEYEDIDFFSKGNVLNPERRRKKVSERHRNRIENEPREDERRRITERTILEPADPQVRSQLRDLYGGRCQICGDTFPQRDGTPFFIVGHIVERKNARLLDNYANALSLCPKHFAQWQHGAIEADNILEQILTKKTKVEGSNHDFTLKISLCGNAHEISYKEKHLVDLQELVKELKKAEE